MGKTRTKADAAKAAAQAHTDLNTFAAVVSILEGGHIYRANTYSAVQRIIKICQTEQAKALREHDRALAEIERF